MNKAKLKSYAPQARREFIQAVTDRARLLGLSEKKIEPMQVQGDVALIGGRPFPREIAAQRTILESLIERKGFTRIMEEAAYTWFNRFCALRYMELHDYLDHHYRVLSNPNGSDIPEILENATSINLPGLNNETVVELRLAGDRDAELYRLLLIAQCNALNEVMPTLFAKTNVKLESGAAGILLPDNLLQTTSPIRSLIREIPEEDWSEIEIMGWLYQFYISEKKDQVIGKVVASEDIPAATQLFTPNWIVRYMVQNTLGRKWMMVHPDSPLAEKMEYFIPPGEQSPEALAGLERITPETLNPEELTFMDPACGSGHILAEAYDLFKEIYLERGYRTRDIPRLILEKNLYGLDIDDRAAQLSRFTLLMKARGDDRSILKMDNPVHLNVMALAESSSLDLDRTAQALLREKVIDMSGRREKELLMMPIPGTQGDLIAKVPPKVGKQDLAFLFETFAQAKTFGSLLRIPENLHRKLPLFEEHLVDSTDIDSDTRALAKQVRVLVEQADLLSREYDFVVANPPYMGSKGQNAAVKSFAKNNFPDSKADLFAMFIERGFDMTKNGSFNSMVTMQSWMFLSSYEKLRSRLLDTATISCMAHMANMVMGIAFGTSATVWIKDYIPNYKGAFCFVEYEDIGEDNKPVRFPPINERNSAAAKTKK